jgi:hypothetical protein
VEKMSKKKKLEKLKFGIMAEAQKVEVLLEQIVYNEDVTAKIQVLADIALERSKRISHLNEKIGRILERK